MPVLQFVDKGLIQFACTDMRRAGKHRYSKKGILSVQSA